MKIIHIAAECYPAAKVGGLGDVLGALGKYLKLAGHDGGVVIPKHSSKYILSHTWEVVFDSKVQLGENSFEYHIYTNSKNELGFNLFLVDIKGLLNREQVYGYHDDSIRFISFQTATLDWIIKTNQFPDVIHVHDHHAALIPFMVKHCAYFKELKETPTILTIHNGQYQGAMDWSNNIVLPNWDSKQSGLLDWNNAFNPLACGVRCAWKISTVSVGYLNELRYQSNGLESLFEAEWNKCIGILNGIDTQVWNPESDIAIVQCYNVSNFEKYKVKNKEILCSQFGLNPEWPLFVFIGRLVWEKAADIIPQSINAAFAALGRELNFLVLGSGDPNIENEFSKIKEGNEGCYNVYIGYNEELSHMIYAGADFILMPSRVEPCGLNQLYAMRYGTIPIVNNTGGLHDTVIDISEYDGYGIKMDTASENDIVVSISRAIDLYAQKETMTKIKKQIMQLDFSWDKSINNYINLYKSLTQ